MQMNQWSIAALVLFGSMILFIFLFRLGLRGLSRLVAKTESKVDDIIVPWLSLPATLIAIILSAAITRNFVDLPARFESLIGLILKFSFIAVFFLFLDRLFRSYFEIRERRPDEWALRSSSHLLKLIVRLLVMSLALLVLLDSMGISITPILASLGIGSLAIALALQDTLANFFSGVHLLMDRPIRVGDVIRLETGDEGTVEKIGWRSTLVRTLPNNVIVIPNSKIASSQFTNYSLNDQELSVFVQIGVGYSSDLGHVEAVTCDVAREVMKAVTGGVTSFEPLVRFHTFGDSAIVFNAILRADQYSNQNLLKHEFIKALHQRYKKEGITIPFPIRTLELAPPLRAALGGIKAPPL